MFRAEDLSEFNKEALDLAENIQAYLKEKNYL